MATGYAPSVVSTSPFVMLNKQLAQYGLSLGETSSSPGYKLALQKLSVADGSGAMDGLDKVGLVTRQQAIDYPSNFIGTHTLRAIATAIGFPNSDTSSSQRSHRCAPISAVVNDVSTNVTGQTLTKAVDNLMDSVFGFEALQNDVRFSGLPPSAPVLSSGYKLGAPSFSSGGVRFLFSGYKTGECSGASSVKSTGEVVQGPTANEYTILAGKQAATLFNQLSNYSPFSITLVIGGTVSDTPICKTPAEQLSIFLRAIFGISDSIYQGWFTSDPLGQEDSGTVLTIIFDNVLGRNHLTAVNNFGGTGVFGRINARQGCALKPYGSNTASPTSFDLKTPSAYFDFVLGSGKTDPKYDILRVRALIQDLLVHNAS
ncbi:hypothetical protein [Candidatus Finniella inopinata]|uniref:Uncharacterized protein n=1 Tax=Candidatus Finniella inopinata TaxID=1696036 RepID=A0A4Q7DG12_9PROT|nr:hypothetical protein [Candidatus Finniella inopinata]RZI45713.1 hypothetical protein EQU50_06330 [Candidatus Finniella inopinata]